MTLLSLLFYMRRILAIGLLAALMGAGCASTPAPTEPQQAPVPNAVTEPVPSSAVAPTPTPVAPKPVTAPAPKPAPKSTVKTVTVEIKDNVFSPQIVAINAGDTILWKNVGSNNHTTRSSASSLLWDSGNLAPGATYRRTFASDGRYEYLCASHAGMKGTVIVGTIRP